MRLEARRHMRPTSGRLTLGALDDRKEYAFSRYDAHYVPQDVRETTQRVLQRGYSCSSHLRECYVLCDAPDSRLFPARTCSSKSKFSAAMSCPGESRTGQCLRAEHGILRSTMQTFVNNTAQERTQNRCLVPSKVWTLCPTISS